MALQGCSSALLKSQTPLQALLEEINFQRTKEMRQILKDDNGFVVLQGTTYWTDLFVRHFLFQSEPVHSIDSDDLLFFVRKKHVKGSSRHMPKYETDVDVYRKDSRKLPIGDPDVDWEETVYLNMVIHQFDYKLTLAICTRTSPKELQVLRRHSQRVYASPSRRKMDTKGENEEMTYPHICFMVDNFDEVFSDILVRDGEMVCVELVASDKDGAVQGVIFLGSIRYDALKRVYDARQSSLSSKVAQRMTFGLFSSGAGVQTRCEFVRMKGPQGKGHAEMAVTKPKGSGVETPTSEPGFCATDMWDDWEDDQEEYYTYRHQRRLSDPSANLNNFSRYAWRSKDNQNTSASSKARSENEGLDNLANEVSEIEAGDLRDDLSNCPASSASEQKLKEIPGVDDIKSPPQSTCCTNCFGSNKCKHWTDTDSAQMSEIYIREIDNSDDNLKNNKSDDEIINDTPACLTKFPNKKQKINNKNILNTESELELTTTTMKCNQNKKLITRSISASSTPVKKSCIILSKKKDKVINIVKKDVIPSQHQQKELKEKRFLAIRNPVKKKNTDNVEKNLTEKNKNSCNLKLKAVGKFSNNNKSNNNNNNNGISSNNNNNDNLKKIKKDRHLSPAPAKPQKIEEIKLEEYEIADDVTSLNEAELIEESSTKMGILNEKDLSEKISVHGKEELPVQPITVSNRKSLDQKFMTNLVPTETENHPLEPIITIKSSAKIDITTIEAIKSNDNSAAINEIIKIKSKSLSEENLKLKCIDKFLDEEEGEEKNLTEQTKLLIHDDGDLNGNTKKFILRTASLPRHYYRRNLTDHKKNAHKAQRLVPKRTTPDGTNIYYWCDLPRKALKELDDGAYNPLWATKGFQQTFHFWKENRRQQSTPLNAFLTYVTLPWWSIAKDLLDHRETPILTF